MVSVRHPDARSDMLGLGLPREEEDEEEDGE